MSPTRNFNSQVESHDDQHDECKAKPLRKPQARNVRQGSAVTARHRAWLMRGRSAYAKARGWLRAPRYRRAAKKWLQMTDNQIRVTTPFKGWSHFYPGRKKNNPAFAPSRWRTWPHAGASIDHDSDGLCGVHGLVQKWRCNVTRWSDPSHAAHRSCGEGLAKVGLKQSGP